MKFSVLFALGALAGSAGTVQADTIIYNGGAPNHVTVYIGDTSSVFTAAADQFTLSPGADTIDVVNWWGGCAGSTGQCPATNYSFAVDFYTNSGGIPGTLVAQYDAGDADQTPTGDSVGGLLTEYSYTYTISDGLTLTPGTTYWLVLSDSTTSAFPWGWESSGSGDHLEFENDGTGWISETRDLAFNLVQETPEPGGSVLAAGGLAMLALVRSLRLRRRT